MREHGGIYKYFRLSFLIKYRKYSKQCWFILWLEEVCGNINNVSIYFKINMIHLWLLITKFVFMIDTICFSRTGLSIPFFFLMSKSPLYWSEQYFLIFFFCNNLVWWRAQVFHGYQVLLCNVLNFSFFYFYFLYSYDFKRSHTM